MDVRLLVVSHAAVLPGNQAVYAALLDEGVDVRLVVPRRWRDAYRPAGFDAVALDALHGRVEAVPVLGAGRPQRHVHLAAAARALRAAAPTAVFVEEEPFSLTGARWSAAASRAGVPVGVQLAEDLDRAVPHLARTLARRTLRTASFVAARSPGAAALAARWGAGGEVGVVPHSVDAAAARPLPAGTTTVAFLGRLVPEKGLEDLLAAVRALDGLVELLVAGDGPLREQVRAAPWTTWLGALAPAAVPAVYERAHVTCVPSRATPTWVEQFGRVAVESLARGVPVVATATGELPWVLSVSGGGVLVDDRDPRGLADALLAVGASGDRGAALGAAGRDGVRRAFSHRAAARALLDLVGEVSPPGRPRAP